MAPESKINLDELEKLCSLQCTQPEIASWFGVHTRSIEKRVAATTIYDRTLESGEKVKLTFREIMDRGYARGKISVRRAQMKLLEEGNATMGVWLGKNILGQRDNLDTTLAAPGGGPVIVSDEGSTLEDRIDRILTRNRQDETTQEPN